MAKSAKVSPLRSPLAIEVVADDPGLPTVIGVPGVKPPGAVAQHDRDGRIVAAHHRQIEECVGVEQTRGQGERRGVASRNVVCCSERTRPITEENRDRARPGVVVVRSDDVEIAITVHVGDHQGRRIVARRVDDGGVERAVAIAHHHVDGAADTRRRVAVVRHDEIEVSVAVEIRGDDILRRVAGTRCRCSSTST